MTFALFLAFLLPLGLVATLTPLVRRVALARDFVDRPGTPGAKDEHKGHARVTALGGGIAVFAGIAVPLVGVLVLAVAGSEKWLPSEVAVHLPGAGEKAPQLAAVLVAVCVLFVVGLVDDLRGLSSTLRLGVQLALGAFLWCFGVGISVFVDVPGASLVLSMLWFSGVTNAFNLLDNTDGLTSGVAVLVCLMLAASLAGPAPQLFVIGLLLVTAGAAFGFWLHNRPPARIFMGDAGSTVLGAMIAVSASLATFFGEEGRTQAHAVAVPLLVLAVPIYDTASVMFLRVRRGVSPFKGDRNHFSHRLARLGLPVWGVLGTIYLATLATGLGALLVDRIPSLGALLLVAQAGMILGIIAILEIAADRASARDSEIEADRPTSTHSGA